MGIAFFQYDAAARESGEERVDRGRILGAADVQRTERREHPRRLEQRPRSGGERLDVWAAVSFGPESGGSAGRVIAGLRFGFE